MKKIFLLFLLQVALIAGSWAQVNQISGTTKSKTRVTFGPDARTASIPAGHAVEIIDGNNYFLTIQYNDGNGYVNRRHIDFDPAELDRLLKSLNGEIDLSQVPLNRSKVGDKYKYEIDHIRYCAGKYRKQVKAGYALGLAGIATYASQSFVNLNDLDTEKAIEQVGLGLGVLGALLIMDSNKWMKRIYFGPDGFGIKYSF
jgi:hypothetical protein